MKFMEGMKAEHCILAGCQKSFTTSNYHIETTPKREWEIVVENRTDFLGENYKKNDRVIQKISELQELPLVKLTKLKMAEIVAVNLYTGPLVSP